MMPIFEDSPERKAERERLMALPFRMVIQDVFNIKGHGIVVTGRIETGRIDRDDAVFISGGDVLIPSTIVAVEMFGSPE